MTGTILNKLITNCFNTSILLNFTMGVILTFLFIRAKESSSLTSKVKTKPEALVVAQTLDTWDTLLKGNSSLCLPCDHLQVDFVHTTIYDQKEKSTGTCCIEKNFGNKDIFDTITQVMLKEKGYNFNEHSEYFNLSWWKTAHAAHIYINVTKSISNANSENHILALNKIEKHPTYFAKDLQVNPDGKITITDVNSKGLYFVYSVLLFKHTGVDFTIYHSLKKTNDTHVTTFASAKYGDQNVNKDYYTSFICSIENLTVGESVYVYGAQNNVGREEKSLENLHHGPYSSFLGIFKLK